MSIRNYCTIKLLLGILWFMPSLKLLGQKKEFKNITIDSATFFRNRALLNNFDTKVFQKGQFSKMGITVPYRFLVPEKKLHHVKYPLVITFHNSTRIGRDNESQLEPLARIWLRKDIYTKYPCFVLVPQFSKRSSSYGYEGNIQHSKPSDEAVLILDLLDSLKNAVPDIDWGRVYLVGYSMGASTALNILNKAPEKIAATVSIAAVPDFANYKNLKDTKLWLIHGMKDIDNPYIGSELMFEKLNMDSNLIFTSYNNLDHNNITIPFLLSEDIPHYLFSSGRRSK